MGLLTGKLEKDMELMREQIRVETPSDAVKRDKLISQAVRDSSLPSEIQKSMSEIIQARLKGKNVSQTPQQDDEEDLRRKLAVAQNADLVNMGTTLQRRATDSGGILTRGKMLG